MERDVKLCERCWSLVKDQGFRDTRIQRLRVNCNSLTGSWSRCIAASWTKRIGSSQPSTMTLGPGPGLSLLYLTLLPASALPSRIAVLICLSCQGQQSQDSAGAPAEVSASDRTLPASRKPQDHAPGRKPVRGLPRWNLNWSSPCCLSRTTRAINSFSDSCPIRSFWSRISSPFPS